MIGTNMRSNSRSLTKTASGNSSAGTDIEMGPLLKQVSASEANLAPINDPSIVEKQQQQKQQQQQHQSDDDNNKGTSYSPSSDMRKSVIACFLYSFCSVSMILTNKSLASSYGSKIDGDVNILLVVFQAIVAVVSVEICKALKIVDYPSFDIKTAMQWSPVNIFFCGMLFTGMASLQFNTVPMVTVFKNVANIVIAFGDKFFFDSRIEGLVVLAFGIMLCGACAAAANDREITTLGLFWMIANCFTSAGYCLYMKFATQKVKLSKFGMVFYNNLLCVLFLLPAAGLKGEINTLLASVEVHTFEYLSKNIFAGFVGFFLNFASLNCVAATGPTTYAIVGSLNKVPTTILGYLLFDTIITPQTWFFICIAMTGGFLYSYAKIRSNRRR